MPWICSKRQCLSADGICSGINRRQQTIITLYYDVLWRQFEIDLVFEIVAEVLDAMAVEYEESIEGRLGTVTAH